MRAMNETTDRGRIEVCTQGPVATVTIANPGKRNALTVAMWNALRTAFERLPDNPALRCVVVRGHGAEGFAAGADIGEFAQVRSTRAQVTAFHEDTVLGALTALHGCPVPVVALIQGACAGGGLEIAAVCDLRIAGRSARLGIPINTLGFSLALGETQALVRLAGAAVAAELLYEGRMLDAPEALAKGLLTRVVDDAQAEAEAMAAAQRIAAGRARAQAAAAPPGARPLARDARGTPGQLRLRRHAGLPHRHPRLPRQDHACVHRTLTRITSHAIPP
jgi:enoyl-CoA hydratase/carnithine racemase